MAYNKLRKLLGMKPKADKTTSEKGITTVTDYFPDFSVKEVAEYREDGSQLSVSRYSKGQISEKPIISLMAGRLSACIPTAF